MIDFRAGARGFDVAGPIVRLPYAGNHEIDVLECMLDMAERLDVLSPDRPRPPRNLRGLLDRDGARVPWPDASAMVKSALRELAAALIRATPRYFPGPTTVAGVSMDELDAFWAELMAWGLHMSFAGAHWPSDVLSVAPPMSIAELVSMQSSASRVDPMVTARIVKLFSFDVGHTRDGALTPFIPVDGAFVPMCAIIMRTSPQRNLLAIVQAPPGLFGGVGRLLGRVGEVETLKLFERLNPDVLSTSRLAVVREDGSPAGDLDVVVCDPTTRTVVVFEVKWSTSSDGNEEVYKSEQAAIKKRAQVVRTRDEIEAGKAVPVWPKEWPDLTGFDFRWYALTRDVLAMREIDSDGVVIRSHQLLQRTLRKGASGRDLVAALAHPPPPPPALTETQWERVRFGELTVELELIVA